MATLERFILKSGAELQVQPASWEKGVVLMERVYSSILGKDPESQFDQVALLDPKVREAIVDVFPWVIYGGKPMAVAIFGDPAIGDRAVGDWFEMASRIVEVNRKHFFPRASSASSAAGEANTKGHG